MADNLTAEQRSKAMRQVRSKNTSPEIRVRALCRAMGATGYRLHRSDIPGTPDLAFIGKRKAIFVHGCFWHGHDCPAGVKVAKTNSSYWETKLKRNVARDKQALAALQQLGWRTLVLWECDLKRPEIARVQLEAFLKSG
jgi:DNA mismatch endonuclease, patch repair protein